MFQGTAHSTSTTLHRGPGLRRLIQVTMLVVAAALAATLTIVLRNDEAPVAGQSAAAATVLSRGMTADTARWIARAEHEEAAIDR